MEIKRHKQKRQKNFKNYFIIILAFWAVMIIFTRMNGDSLIELNYKTTEKLLPLLAPFYKADLQIESVAFDNNFDVSLATASIVEDVAKVLENLIHVILFALLSTICFFNFNKFHLKYYVNILITLTSCVLLAYFSETYQNNVSMRGYERIDVVNNLYGVCIGLALFLIYIFITWLIELNKKPIVSKRYIFEFSTDRGYDNSAHSETYIKRK